MVKQLETVHFSKNQTFFKKENIMKNILLGTLFILSMGLCTAQAASTPLRLDYTVTPTDNNRYYYDFTLTLTNDDNSWVSGHGWGNFRFGNSPDNQTPIPLANFVGDLDSLADQPFDTFSPAAPIHGLGPLVSDTTSTLGTWFPTAVGDSVGWGGTSTANLEELRWSVHKSTAVGFNFPRLFSATAHRIDPIPEPGTFVLAGMGLLSLMGLRRRVEK